MYGKLTAVDAMDEIKETAWDEKGDPDLPDAPCMKLQRCSATPVGGHEDTGPDEPEAKYPFPSESLLRTPVVENEHQFQELLSHNSSSYARYFRDPEEYSAFMMLPVNESQRADLLRRMIEDAKMQKMKPRTWDSIVTSKRNLRDESVS